MRVEEQVPLRSLTTFRIGGPARYVITIEKNEEVAEAAACAVSKGLPLIVLGEGSNVLARDEEIPAVILRIGSNTISAANDPASNTCLVTVDAGTSWETLVQYACTNGLWGVENLAGIPGTVGASPVQNIGAYGVSVSETIEYVQAYDTVTNEFCRIENHDCRFSYRQSRFKEERNLIILQVAFRLSRTGTPAIGYPDFAAAVERGEVLTDPSSIATAVRGIRSKKFPNLSETGTAGSFFKNPVVTPEKFEELKSEHPMMPSFPQTDGVKIPLAWILDHVLSMRGYTKGSARLFEKQPLVMVAEFGATAIEVKALAHEVEEKVFSATGITIEREVQML